MASAIVGLPIMSYQWSTGTWLVTMVDRFLVAVLDDLQEIAPLLVAELLGTPVVQ